MMTPKIRTIVRTLGRLSQRWLQRDFPYRRQAVRRLVENSGYTAPMAEAALDALFRELTAARLWRLLSAELGDPLALDGFRRDPVTGHRRRALGPARILHIFSANVPNPSVVSLVLGLLAKSENILRPSRRDAGILDIYVRSLKAHDGRLARSVRLLKPDDDAARSAAMHRASRVVAYGSDETLRRIRRALPEETAFSAYGHRLSIAVLTREALTDGSLLPLARACARDLWMLAGRGCLTPQVIYIERARLKRAFAAALRRELNKLGLPEARRAAVAMDVKSPVRIATFGGDEDLIRKCRPLSGYLQAVALEARLARRERLAERLAALGANRICRAGRLQDVPLTWHHDGRPNLSDWVNWTDLET